MRRVNATMLRRLLVRGSRGQQWRYFGAGWQFLQEMHVPGRRDHLQGPRMRLQRTGKPQRQVLPTVRPGSILQTSGAPSPSLQKRRALDIPVSDLRVPGNESVERTDAAPNISSCLHTCRISRLHCSLNGRKSADSPRKWKWQRIVPLPLLFRFFNLALCCSTAR